MPLSACENYSGHACGNGGETTSNGVITMAMGEGGNQSTPLNALSFNGGLGGNHLYCCGMYQETDGFYHDYSCVQSTLNLETRNASCGKIRCYLDNYTMSNNQLQKLHKDEIITVQERELKCGLDEEFQFFNGKTVGQKL